MASAQTFSPSELANAPPAVFLCGVIDCFLVKAGHHTDSELEFFDKIIELVMAKVEPAARAELAARLADQARPPRRVLIKLAADDIEIAQPMLARSPALTDADLETLARYQSQPHLVAIAGRPSLSERVTDVLVSRGDDKVIDRVVGNPGARISVQSFRNLARRMTGNESWRQAFAARPDLPDEIAARFDPLIRQSVKDAIEALDMPIDDPMHAELVEKSRTVLADRLRAAGAPARPPEYLLDLVARGLLHFDDAASELADADDAVGLAKLIASRIDVSPQIAMQVLFAAAENTMMVMCRASRLGLNGFSAVLRMRRRRLRQPGSSPGEVMTAFSRLPQETTERAIRLFKRQLS